MKIELLHRFLRQEFENEAASGFALAKRIPDTRVKHFLDYFGSLDVGEQDELAHACTLFGSVRISGSAGASYLESVIQLPAWKRWRHESVAGVARDPHYYYSVYNLRDYLGQINCDMALGRPVSVPLDWMDYAKSVHGVKTAELRKRLRLAMTQLYGAGLVSVTNKAAEYDGTFRGQTVQVGLDLIARYSQLEYQAAVGQKESPGRLSGAGYEIALGMGLGHWNFNVAENLDDSIALLCTFVQYVAELPRRMRAGSL